VLSIAHFKAIVHLKMKNHNLVIDHHFTVLYICHCALHAVIELLTLPLCISVEQTHNKMLKNVDYQTVLVPIDFHCMFVFFHTLEVNRNQNCYLHAS